MRPEWPTSVYLDTSALVAAVRKGEYSAQIGRILEQVDQGAIRLFVSPLLYVEALGHSRTEPFDPQAEAKLLATLDSPRVIPVEFSRFVAKRARAYCHNLRLKPYDAIHLASAVVAEAEVLMCCDKGFPLDQTVDRVYVSKPYAPGGPDLFTETE